MLVKILNFSFLLLIFSLPFVQPLNFNLFNSDVQFTDVIFLFVAVIFVILILMKKTEFIFHRFYFLLVFYFLAILLSLIFSTNSKQSTVKICGEIYLIGLCVLTVNVVRTADVFKKVVLVWLAAAGIVSFIGTLTVILFYVAPDNVLLSFTLHHYGTLFPGNYPRIQTTFYYPAMLCHYLSISLLLLFISIKNGWIYRSMFIILLTVVSICLFFTLTPGLGGVCLSVGIWLWLILREKSNLRSARLILFAGVFLSVIFIFVTLISPIQTSTSPYFVNVPIIDKRLDPSVRVLTWQSSLETFLKYPIFGKGVGTDAADVIYKDASGRTQNLRDAHQLWLNVAAQEGIFGLAAITAITVYFFLYCFPPTFDGTEKKVVQTGLAIAFLSAFVFQGLFGSFENARHLWILFGLILSVEKFNS